jgi:hypothetical protein
MLDPHPKAQYFDPPNEKGSGRPLPFPAPAASPTGE